MGRQHRVTKSRSFSVCMLAAVWLCGGALCACSKQQDQKALMRREVLRANNLAAERRQDLDAVRVTDEHGDLLARKEAS